MSQDEGMFRDLEEMYNTPRFHICQGCGRKKVFRPGERCRSCAVVHVYSHPDDAYFIVEPNLINEIQSATGIAGDFLLAKYRNLHELKCFYIVFHARGEWQDIVIDERFHVPTVMKHLFQRLHD